MDQVLHVGAVPRATQVAADRARGGRRRVGRAHEDAHAFDDALAFDDDGDDGAGAHELQEALEEGLVLVVGVVLGEQLAGGDHELEALDRVALGLDAAQDFTGQAAGVAVGLHDDEGVLQGGVEKVLRLQQNTLSAHIVSFDDEGCSVALSSISVRAATAAVASAPLASMWTL